MIIRIILFLFLGLSLEAKHYSSEHKNWENKFINSKDYDALIAINLLHNATNNSYTCKDVLHVQKEVKKAGYCKNTDFKSLENGFKQWAISEFGDSAKKNYKDYFYIFEKVTVLKDHAELQGGYGSCVTRYKHEGENIKSFEEKWSGACGKFIKYQSKLEKGNQLLVSQLKYSQNRSSQSQNKNNNVNQHQTELSFLERKKLLDELAQEFRSSDLIVNGWLTIIQDEYNKVAKKQFNSKTTLDDCNFSYYKDEIFSNEIEYFCRAIDKNFSKFNSELKEHEIHLTAYSLCRFANVFNKKIKNFENDFDKLLERTDKRCYAQDLKNFEKEIKKISKEERVPSVEEEIENLKSDVKRLRRCNDFYGRTRGDGFSAVTYILSLEYC